MTDSGFKEISVNDEWSITYDAETKNPHAWHCFGEYLSLFEEGGQESQTVLFQEFLKQSETIQTIVEFRDEYEISCPESIYQRDAIIENALEFIEKLIESVGYLPREEEE